MKAREWFELLVLAVLGLGVLFPGCSGTGQETDSGAGWGLTRIGMRLVFPDRAYQAQGGDVRATGLPANVHYLVMTAYEADGDQITCDQWEDFSDPPAAEFKIDDPLNTHSATLYLVLEQSQMVTFYIACFDREGGRLLYRKTIQRYIETLRDNYLGTVEVERNDVNHPDYNPDYPDCLDGDGDEYGVGNCRGIDCNEKDMDTYFGAPQLCDGKNNDCDANWPTPPADERDDDMDTFMICAGDCDDENEQVHPGADDLCNGDTMDDCDTSTPDGSGEAWYGDPCDGPDRDLCDEEGQLLCDAGEQYCSDDPNENDMEGPPGDPTCSDGIDNDCDGLTDDGDPDCVVGM